ncbi:MAG: hypothetical protein AAF766_14575 [Cyanobacteria bacterium P01_D01_bin.14]
MKQDDTKLISEQIQERTIIIPKEYNTLEVHLRNSSWISIINENTKIYCSDDPGPTIQFSVTPGSCIVRTDGDIEKALPIKAESLPSILDLLAKGPPPQLLLTSDAPDQHIVDGIGEIPADGTSFCTITIEKIAFDSTPVTEETLQDELFLRTTGGLIKDETGQNHIRSLNLQSGRAAFRLVSEPNPKVVTVSVLSKDPMLANAEIQIEFV